MRRWTIAILLAVACEREPKPVPPAAYDPAMRRWILDCIEKANPHSDEEPEDNTAQCEETATRLFCGPTCFISLGGSVLCRPKPGEEGGHG